MEILYEKDRSTNKEQSPQSRGGSVSKYTKALKQDIYDILVESNCTQKELCRQINISKDQFIQWQKEDSEVYKADLPALIKLARKEFIRSQKPLIVNTLYKKALGYEIPIVADGKKYIPPDIKAIEFILLNGEDGEYKNKQSIEVDNKTHLSIDDDTLKKIQNIPLDLLIKLKNESYNTE